MPPLPGADERAYIVSFLLRILRSPFRTAPRPVKEAELRGFLPRSRYRFEIDETWRKEESEEVLPYCCSRQTAARLSAYRNIDSVVAGLATVPSLLRSAHGFDEVMLKQEPDGDERPLD